MRIHSIIYKYITFFPNKKIYSVFSDLFGVNIDEDDRLKFLETYNDKLYGEQKNAYKQIKSKLIIDISQNIGR